MNKANKITITRIIMSMIIILLLLFPFDEVGLEFPTYLVGGKVLVDLKYIIVGILFIIASLTDFLDGYVARKYNLVTDFGKMIDAISDKLLTNSVLIILACNGKISTIVAVVIVMRDIVVDSIKMVIGNQGAAVAAIGLAKVKTATLMVGIILTLFSNLPFELISLRISDFLLAIAAVLSIISAAKYYIMAKPYLQNK
ncbi:MAG: CDP-diacylglycerol--glycerol-3-phosphate 3-phosphatidyltransferase [Bacilli bacterium]|mgnify:FL=1|jgi:CDP-diacylglycerol--glycerol-3-phosphate 3-phosphatidyltransferase|nr:CDP-diacylglycerol--glycerol-3-phosphate 3-phosphatidyltransferase [Bacilli bacterium]MEE1371044.1 CDP-diacylglycerol--glycerol-3-phosphate 3-phosphatidyltransferase [Bacilli bacterium]